MRGKHYIMLIFYSSYVNLRGIYCNDDKFNTNNHKPLTNVVTKIIEKSNKSRILLFPNKHGISHTNQRCFRNKHDTYRVILRLKT